MGLSLGREWLFIFGMALEIIGGGLLAAGILLTPRNFVLSNAGLWGPNWYAQTQHIDEIVKGSIGLSYLVVGFVCQLYAGLELLDNRLAFSMDGGWWLSNMLLFGGVVLGGFGLFRLVQPAYRRRVVRRTATWSVVSLGLACQYPHPSVYALTMYALCFGLKRRSGESFEDYATRVWKADDVLFDIVDNEGEPKSRDNLERATSMLNRGHR